MKNLITGLLFCLLSGAVCADTWTVDDDGPADFDNIQAAVDVAFQGDEILVYPGTYTSTDLYYVVDVYLWRDLWIHSVGGPAVTTIDGENTRAGVGFPGGVLEGFTITNCSASYAAGVKANFGATIKDCVITGNHAASLAGGIFIGNESEISIVNCTIQGNTCGVVGDNFGFGAGVYIVSGATASLTGCNIQDNVNTLLDGGGLFIGDLATVAINDCVIQNNTAVGNGGGLICAKTSDTTIFSSTICGNTPNNIVGPWIVGDDVCLADSCEDANGNGSPDECEALQDGIHVPSDYATIQLAIEAAVNGDTIYVDPGTWTGSGSAVINTIGKAITVESVLGASVTIIDAEGVRRGVEILNGESDTTIIKGFTVIGGTASEGGGIFCSNSSPQLVNCVVTGNETTGDYPLGGGGGICLRQSDATVIGCTISDNEALGDSAFGGGIFCREGNPTITDCVINDNVGSLAGGLSCFISNTVVSGCTISGNNATDPYFGDGGGIQNYGGNLQILNCSVTNNAASWGGGGFGMLGGGTTVITSSTIDSNTAREGGGLYPGGDVTIQDCTISNNVATHIGGGTRLWSEVTITNSTFESNDAILGGAMYCNGSPEIRDCTISGNTSWAGGGIWAGNGASPQLINCVLHNNASDVFSSSAICSHDTSVVTLTDCSLTSDLLDGGEVFADFSSAVMFLGTCESESMNAVSGSSLLFGPDSTCDVSGNIIPSLEGSISFDIDDLETTPSISVLGLLQKRGCLRVSNDSGSLTNAQIGDVIPLAEAWYVTDSFESVVVPSMPTGFGLQVVEQQTLRGAVTTIVLEVVEVEHALFSNPFTGDLDSSPVDVKSFDADGDGADEIAVLFGGNPGGVAVYAISEDGAPSLIAGFSAEVGNDPVDLDAGDLDGDGLEDLLVANSTSNTITVLVTTFASDGTLTFTDTTINTSDMPTCVAVIDWDVDADLDAVVGIDITDPNAMNGYQVLLDVAASISTGPWLEIPNYELPDNSYVSDPPTCVDGGDQTSAWGFVGGTRYGRIHRGTSGGSLQVIDELEGNNTVTIEAIELDADGGDSQIDLMVASDEAETIYLFQGNASEADGFEDLIPLAVSEPAQDVLAIDADDDGDMDIVITAPTSDTPLVLLRNDGGGTGLVGGLNGITWSKQDMNSGNPFSNIEPVDVNDTKDLDKVIVGAGGATNLRGELAGTMEQTNILLGSDCDADLDGNGSVDIDDLLAFISAWGPCSEVCPADFDGDNEVGIDDLLVLIAAFGPCE